MEYAVFTTGGKQYRVKEVDKVKVEKLVWEYQEGDSITFDKVLLLDNGEAVIKLGTPFVSDATVKATLKKIGRAKKINVMHYKPKSRYFKQYGHRQPYFEIQVDSIE